MRKIELRDRRINLEISVTGAGQAISVLIICVWDGGGVCLALSPLQLS